MSVNRIPGCRKVEISRKPVVNRYEAVMCLALVLSTTSMDGISLTRTAADGISTSRPCAYYHICV
ncbi:hypothetical protein CCHR01_17694 [Colletotrichum chrysophilum]|uniref:Uncharacterized protein n=1 Tax=Colletotrichum chrysophilum TaxID=1836956 RepID=A0AAD9A3W3_9PEZI|nr:hypothetical protein K456DRAFT_1217514 [Colletotrichum gloeosporioides 23]KAK1839677.1 hypothetical protein CCHR01_17694 [Colletotrichum chrysophilum]